MTEVGRRPTLYELLEALRAIFKVEADQDALDAQAETFRVVFTFRRSECPQDWQDGQPKPTWLIDQLIEELSAWLLQRNREAQWVSKEERMGSSIDTLMAHYTEELKKSQKATPQNIVTRMQARVFADTILRLKELKERREAGGVYSQTESRREKARKTWAEEEFEGPKREKQQRDQYDYKQQYNQTDSSSSSNPFGFDSATAEEILRQWADGFGRFYRDGFEQAFYYGRGGEGPFNSQSSRPPPQQPPGKTPWYVTLGVTAKASKDEIRKAYRRLARKFHPDVSQEPDAAIRMAEINTARDEGLGGL